MMMKKESNGFQRPFERTLSPQFLQFDAYEPSWAIHPSKPVFVTHRVRSLAVLDIGLSTMLLA